MSVEKHGYRAITGPVALNFTPLAFCCGMNTVSPAVDDAFASRLNRTCAAQSLAPAFLLRRTSILAFVVRVLVGVPRACEAHIRGRQWHNVREQ